MRKRVPKRPGRRCSTQDDPEQPAELICQNGTLSVPPVFSSSAAFGSPSRPITTACMAWREWSSAASPYVAAGNHRTWERVRQMLRVSSPPNRGRAFRPSGHKAGRGRLQPRRFPPASVNPAAASVELRAAPMGAASFSARVKETATFRVAKTFHSKLHCILGDLEIAAVEGQLPVRPSNAAMENTWSSREPSSLGPPILCRNPEEGSQASFRIRSGVFEEKMPGNHRGRALARHRDRRRQTSRSSRRKGSRRS